MAITIDGTTGITTPGLVNTGTESVVNITSTGNLNFGGTAQRITGDMSNATVASRVMFQTSTTNGATAVGALPNGTSAVSTFNAYNSSDTTNNAYFQLAALSTEVRLGSTISGTGTYLPIAFHTGGGEKLRLDTSGNLLVGTTSASVPSTTGFVSSANTFGFKNRIINGGMVIDQRNAGASVTPNNVYTLDRWIGVTGGVASKYSVQQNAGAVTTPAGFTNYLGVTSLSAYAITSTDRFGVAQYIEGFNTADLGFGTANASTVTVSFLVYSSLTGTFGGSLQNYLGTRSYPFSYSIPVANTWTKISITIAGDTSGTWVGASNSGSIALNFSTGTGSTLSGTAGVWAGADYRSATGSQSVVGTSGATFYITGVQLEKGSVATSFDQRAYSQELAMCQRYCMSWTSSSLQSYLCVGQCYTTTQALVNLPLPVVPRTKPTGIFVSAAADFGCLSPNGSASIGSTMVINAPSNNNLSISFTSTTAVFVTGNATTLYTQPTATNALIYTTGCEL